ncbi:hypothetical protein QJQ45_017616, partial [Haematococcus lacustris]
MAVALGLATGAVYFLLLDLPPGLPAPGSSSSSSSRRGAPGQGQGQGAVAGPADQVQVPQPSRLNPNSATSTPGNSSSAGSSAGAGQQLGPGLKAGAGGVGGRGAAGGGQGPPTATKPILQQRLSARPDSPESGWAVYGLALVGGEWSALVLMVVTEAQTLAFTLHSSHKSILDHQGVKLPGCTAMRHPMPEQGPGPSSTLLVARDEGLYDYTVDTRAGCTVFEGAKQCLALLRRFVVVVTHETSDVTGLSSATLHIADLRHKLIAGSLTLASVAAVVPFVPCEGGQHAGSAALSQGGAAALYGQQPSSLASGSLPEQQQQLGGGDGGRQGLCAAG